jgi:hypothetical protein
MIAFSDPRGTYECRCPVTISSYNSTTTGTTAGTTLPSSLCSSCHGYTTSITIVESKTAPTVRAAKKTPEPPPAFNRAQRRAQKARNKRNAKPTRN